MIGTGGSMHTPCNLCNWVILNIESIPNSLVMDVEEPPSDTMSKDWDGNFLCYISFLRDQIL